jgi:cytochrome P450
MGAGIGTELPLVRAIGSHLPIQAAKEMFRANDYLLRYGTRAIENAKSLHDKANIFTTILHEAEKGEGYLTDLDVRIEAGNLIVAGSDTTGVTLTYLTWSVLKRPELRIALEEEVSALGEEIKDADLETLPLLNAVIEETLRLYGAAPGSLPRVVPLGGTTQRLFYPSRCHC